SRLPGVLVPLLAMSVAIWHHTSHARLDHDWVRHDWVRHDWVRPVSFVDKHVVMPAQEDRILDADGSGRGHSGLVAVRVEPRRLGIATGSTVATIPRQDTLRTQGERRDGFARRRGVGRWSGLGRSGRSPPRREPLGEVDADSPYTRPATLVRAGAGGTWSRSTSRVAPATSCSTEARATARASALVTGEYSASNPTRWSHRKPTQCRG